MPIQAATPFSINQGLSAGLDINRNRRASQQLILDEAYRQKALEQERIDAQAKRELAQQQLGETAREFDVGQGFKERTWGDDFGLSQRKFGLESELGRGELGLKSRAQKLAEAESARRSGLDVAKLELEARAQTLADRQARAKEQLEGRALTLQEQQDIWKKALAQEGQRLEWEKQGLAAELGRGELSQKQAAIDEAKRAALVFESYRNRELAQQGARFERGQTEIERAAKAGESEKARAARVSEALAETAQQLEAEKVHAGIGIAGRQQTEAEKEGAFGRGYKDRSLAETTREFNVTQQIERLKVELDNQVRQRTLTIQEAANIQTAAQAAAKHGLDVQEFLWKKATDARDFAAGEPKRQAEVENLQANAAGNLASAAAQTPWQIAAQQKKDAEQAATERTALGIMGNLKMAEIGAGDRGTKDSLAEWKAKQDYQFGLQNKLAAANAQRQGVNQQSTQAAINARSQAAAAARAEANTAYQRHRASLLRLQQARAEREMLNTANQNEPKTIMGLPTPEARVRINQRIAKIDAIDRIIATESANVGALSTGPTSTTTLSTARGDNSPTLTPQQVNDLRIRAYSGTGDPAALATLQAHGLH